MKIKSKELQSRLISANEIVATTTQTVVAAGNVCYLFAYTHTHTRLMRPQRWRRLRRKVVYSFSFSQNKMDCSLTKTVSRRSESAREQHMHGAPPARTKRSTEYARCVCVCLSRSNMHNCLGRRLPFTVDTLETSDSNAHIHLSGSAARLLKNSQNRYEYNAFTLFTHSLARVLAPCAASVCAQLPPPPIPIQVAQWPCSNWKLNSFRVEIESAWICMSVCTLMQKYSNVPCRTLAVAIVNVALLSAPHAIIESHHALQWATVKAPIHHFLLCSIRQHWLSIWLPLSLARVANSLILCRQCKEEAEHKWMVKDMIVSMNTCESLKSH